MTRGLSRRQFLDAALAAGTAVAASGNLLNPTISSAKEPRSANEKLNLAVIGVAAQGKYNLDNVSSENIVCLCDIDDQRMAAVADKYPNAKKLYNFRDVLELPNLDGIVCSTPDHVHAFVTAAALRKGLPIYCEKPLTHSVWEAREIRKLNATAGVPTQMGTQIHAGSNYRRVVELIRAGTIGTVNRVHVWVGGGPLVFPNVKTSAPPSYVHYDEWIGPAPYRPFSESHFHFNWRFWWDFGGGHLADIGCHYMDLPFWVLELGAPLTVSSIGEKGHDGDNECPMHQQVDYQFAGRGDQPPVHLTWYHGGKYLPEGAGAYGQKSAILFEGTEGRLIADYKTHKIFMQEGKTAAPVKPWIADSVAGHHAEWISAIKNNGTTSSHFGYATNLTEAVLLGNVSYRAGKPIKWDAAALKTDSPDADKFLKREYRAGWTL